MACLPCMAVVPGALPLVAAIGIGIWQFGIDNRVALLLLIGSCIYAEWVEQKKSDVPLIALILIIAFLLFKKKSLD